MACGDVPSKKGLGASMDSKDAEKKSEDEKLETTFYLYTHNTAKSASMTITDDKKTTKQMTKIYSRKDEEGCLWEAKITFESYSAANQFEYYYTLDRKWKGPKAMLERRTTKQGSTNYDNFHEQNDSSRHETIFYSKWFLEKLNEQNFNECIQAIKGMNFNFPANSSKYLKMFVSWICGQKTKDCIPKCLYLGVLLALVSENNIFDWQKKTDEQLSVPFADNFLDVLRSHETEIRSLCDNENNLVHYLRKLAPKLVHASSFAKWLSYASSFYPYFGVKEILANNDKFNQDQVYPKGKYEELTECLTRFMTADRQEKLQGAFLQILERILVEAPNIDAVVVLYQSNEFLNLFRDTEEQNQLFENVLKIKAKKILISNKGQLSIPLAEISKIPEKMHKGTIKINVHLYLLLEFIDFPSSFSPREKEENASEFCKELCREDLFSIKEIISVLHALVKSNQHHCHEMFLFLVKRQFYQTWWEKLGKIQHVSILSKWLTADLTDKSSKSSHCKPRDLFERAEILKASNLFSDDIIQEACFQGSAKKMDNITLKSILNALATVEKSPPCLQECYKKIFASALKKATVKDIVSCCKKKCWFTDNSPSPTQIISGLAESLLVQVLDSMDWPWMMNSSSQKFNELIDLSDLWVTIFSAEGCIQQLQKHETFNSAKESLQALFSCLEKYEISVRLFQNVINHRESLSEIFVYLERPSEKKQRNFKTIQNNFFDRIQKISKLVESYKAQLDTVQSAILICRNVSKKVKIEICDFGDVSKVYEHCNSDERSIKSIKTEDFWGILSVVKSSQDLKYLRECTSFKQVAERLLKQKYVELSKVTFPQLLKFLNEDCIGEFRSEWHGFHMKPDDDSHTLEKLDNLIGNVPTEENLKKEIEILEKYFKKPFPNKLEKYLGDYAIRDKVLKEAECAISVLENFGFAKNPDRHAFLTLESFITEVNDKNKLSLKKYHTHCQNVQKHLTYTSHTKSVLQYLQKSPDVVMFVQKTISEDLHFIIEEAEEHKEQLKVSEALITKLIDVHQFLGRIIKLAESSKSVKEFFLSLDKLLLKEISAGIDIKNMMEMIGNCNVNISSLDGLYKSVANRVEISKGVIANCLKNGKYSVHVNNNGDCVAKIKYDEINGEHFLPALHNLRSRAYLLMNSAENKMVSGKSRRSTTSRSINYRAFIKQVDLLTEICDLLTEIRPLEYPMYDVVNWNLQGTPSLKEKENDLRNHLEMWKSALSAGRNGYIFLNFYRSHQVRVFYQLIIDCSKVDHYDKAISLFKIIDPKVEINKVQETFTNFTASNNTFVGDSPEAVKALVKATGEALQTIFKDTVPATRPLALPVSASSSTEYVVKDGEIYIVKLDDESPQTANVMLTIYASTCKSFPQPHEILFCSVNTELEEVDLLLNRCSFVREQELGERKSLHCIANVDLLQPEIRHQLEMRLKDQHLGSRLVLICRGKKCDRIFREFDQFTHQVSGMTDTALTTCLQEKLPNVVVYTSALPGLGKTERIKTDACEKSKSIITCMISDSIDWNKLVTQLACLPIKEHHCLHFDISLVDDPSMLDSFLFQLIVIGMVSSDVHVFHLPTSCVYIEIANTLQDSLRDSLQICKYFTCVRLGHFNYDDLVVSPNIHSNVQIVCHYLNAAEKESLESKDISFRDKSCPIPLTRKECSQLLSKYFPSNQDISFTVLKTVLAFLASQLRKFSESFYFKVNSLKSMLKEKSCGIRTNFLLTLLEVSKEFSSRSIRTCSTQQDEATSKTTVNAMIKRVEGMVQWEDTNHLILVFHQGDSQAATAIYRNRDSVPESIKVLLNSQAIGHTDRKKQDIEDFSSMKTDELKAKLLKIASTETTVANYDGNMDPTYVVTSDNIHKMILIILRVRGRIPVILMGETGCGKTSLVRYLAITCKIPFSVFSLHAGIHQHQIVQFIEKKEAHAKKETWVFLDEINTTDHLGLISEIMCHHTLFGRPLSKNLVFLAACNPYKLRPKEHIKTAGLEHKSIESDEYSRLVYRVHPLPEAMIDYVWDFGFLQEKDERKYIERMVGRLNYLVSQRLELLSKLLSASQMFIRKTEENFSVSLRDVSRCITLIEWFQKTVIKLDKVNENSNSGKKLTKDLSEEHDISNNCYAVIKSFILGLAHCYMYRLSTTKMRNEYCKEMEKISEELNARRFTAVVRIMEENFLNRMILPPGTCKNSFLRENVFVILVCILNRIPVFVVGKPGCSKSLSMRLIKTNLLGRDSKDAFFKTLPHIYVISYQTSESSTSEGIERVFEKARKYADCNKDILPVVLLDEVGLAECSKHNPLKVLHSLLEPDSTTCQTKPQVAVVGISNWTLDAAKMNRAIHLSKPDPDVDDLHSTALSIMCDIGKDGLDKNRKKIVRKLAETYHKYQREQKFPNFHGLRDYYSLLKNLMNNGSRQLPENTNLAVQRNFGGLPRSETEEIQRLFLNNKQENKVFPVTELILQNLLDPLARHLMLFTHGDSAIDILSDILSDLKREVVTIYGSRFDEDQTEEYNYRILSRILLNMEQSRILILRDLELIYGALYDMLNQSYTIVDGKKMSRVAIGPDSNPTCLVNDEFRCIVLKDDKEIIELSDPPFYNRFEKQLLRYSNVLSEEETASVADLLVWIEEISEIEGMHHAFGPQDMFIGFHEDTLYSLVFSHSKTSPNEDLLEICKADLMWLASPEGVVRAKRSDLFKKDNKEIENITEKYFEKPIHHGLAHFINAVRESNDSYLAGDKIGSKCVVMTYSNSKIDGINGTIEVLCSYNSEKQLTEAMKSFFDSESDVLIVQCYEIDAPNLLLARSIIENERRSYAQWRERQKNSDIQRKHVIMLMHLERQNSNTSKPALQFSFCGGWKQIFLDVLDHQTISICDIHSASIQTMLQESIWPLKQIAKDVLLRCFSCIEYNQEQRDLKSIYHIIDNLLKSEKVVCALNELINRWLTAKDESTSNRNLQVEIACKKEQLLYSPSFFSAVKKNVFNLIRVPLEKFVFFMESNNAWPPLLFWTSNGQQDEQLISDLESLWCEMLLNNEIFDMEKIPELQECGVYRVSNALSELHFPFTNFVITEIEKQVKQLFLDQLKNDSDEQKSFQHLENIVAKSLPEIVSSALTDEAKRSIFQDDVFDWFSVKFKMLTREQRVSIVTASLAIYSDQDQRQQIQSPASFCLQLLTGVWKKQGRLFDQLQMITAFPKIVEKGVLSHTIQDASARDSSTEECKETEESEPKSDQESDISTDGENWEEDKFESALLANWSKALLPNRDSVETMNNGLESWIANVRILLLFARRMENFPNSLHFLHFCVDFASIVLLPSELPIDLLYKLGEIGRRHDADESNYLESFEVFNEISDFIINLERNHHTESNISIALNAQLFGRCIETDIDMDWMEAVIARLGREVVRGKKTVSIMIPVIWRILECEKEEISDFVMGYFNDEISSQNLLALNATLKEINCPGKSHTYVSYACAAMCDIIQSLLDPVVFEIDLKSGEIGCTKLARKAVDILSRANESIDLKVLTAVAYIRGFLVKVSHEVLKNPYLLVEEISVESSLAQINSMLKERVTDGQQQSPLLIFILKQMLAGKSMHDLRKMCLSSTSIDSIASCFPNENFHLLKANFSFFANFKIYKEAEKAYLELEQSSLTVVQKMTTFFNECKRSSKHILAFMELLLVKFVLKRAIRKLNDSEAKIAMWLSEQINNLPQSEATLLLDALINENFNDGFLQLSSESHVSDVQQALLILHIACATSVKDVKYEPSLLFSSLRHGKNWNTQFSIDLSILQEHVVFSCICGRRICTRKPCFSCPNCETKRKIAQNEIQDGPQMYETLKEEVVLNNFASHTLRFFVYANIYAGKALGFTGQEGTEIGIRDCLQNVQKELKRLIKIVNLTETQVVCLIHLVVQQCHHFMSHMSGRDSKTWLNDFSDHSTSVLNRIHDQNRKFKEYMILQAEDSSDGSPVEHKILELDPTQQTSPQHLQHHQLVNHLFRMIKAPSFEGFRLCFEMSTDECKAKNKFLSFFFSKRSTLEKIGNLHPILEWTRFVYSHLNHRISREEAKSTNIDHFLNGKMNLKWTDKEKKQCEELFPQFKRAWQHVREDVNSQLKDGVDKMPNLNEKVLKLSYCIIDKNDEKGMFIYMAIKYLCSAQNEIIDELLRISAASQDDHSLDFLRISESYTAVEVTSVEIARREDIIHFEWNNSELLSLAYAYNDLDYGMGEIVHYDFKRISAKLAESIAFNKQYLDFRFERFIFSNEFFDSCSELLVEIGKLIPQQHCLPEEVETNLKKLSNYDSQELLAHLEMLMFFLKRISSVENVVLLSFIEEWNYMLPKPFPTSSLPEPRSKIELKDIVALCEELEYTLADSAKDALHDEFRKKLTEETEAKLESLIDDLKNQHGISLHQFHKVLLRFVFRYHSSPNFTSEKTLSACLVNNSLWSDGAGRAVPSPEIYPNEIKLEYVYETLAFIDEKLNGKPDDDQRKSGMKRIRRGRRGAKIL